MRLGSLGSSLVRTAMLVLAGAAALTLAASGAGATAPSGQGKHCGLFQSGREWHENAQTHGHFYSYGVHKMKCHVAGHGKPASNPIIIATLGLHGERHPYGFTCTVDPPLNSGYCYKGKRARRKYVVWAPEADCADPNPPYTPATLPSKCHT